MSANNFELLRETALADLKKAKRASVIPYILIALSFAGAAVGITQEILSLSVISFICFFICAIWSTFTSVRVGKAYNTYNLFVKRHLVTEALSQTVTIVSYRADGHFPKEDFETSELFPHFSVLHGNDLLEAVYKDRHFIMCDAHLLKRVKTQHGSSLRTTFKGRFIVLDSENYTDSDSLQTNLSARIERFGENIGEEINFKFSDGKVLIAWEYGGDIMETDYKGKTNTAEDRERIVSGFKQVTDFLDSLPEKAHSNRDERTFTSSV
jgi:hypothetical protein